MKMITIRASRRVYTVFTIMFGGLGLIFFVLLYFKNGIYSGLTISSPYFLALLIIYSMLSIYKISYDDKQIKYRGLFGTKIINIMDIKRYKIKSTVDATKPTVGLYIDTVNKKSEIVIPAKLFTSESLNDLMNHINTINGSAKGKANAGKSVFKYREKKKV